MPLFPDAGGISCAASRDLSSAWRFGPHLIVATRPLTACGRYRPGGLGRPGQIPVTHSALPGRRRNPLWQRVLSNGGQLNERAYEHARKLIAAGKYVIDDRDAWSEHQPSAQQEKDFIERHGVTEYARWHLGIEDDADEDGRDGYKFPYGDFHNVHPRSFRARWRAEGIGQVATSRSERAAALGDRIRICVNDAGERVAPPSPTSRAVFDAITHSGC